MMDSSSGSDAVGGMMSAGSDSEDGIQCFGSFHYELFDSLGNLLWEDVDHNLFTTIAKNAMLNAGYNASSTLVGPYMGLISSASFTAVSAADTMASHTGWLEANATNAPAYTGNRQTAVYGVASAGTITATALSFVFTNTGTVQGSFIVGGSGAIVTNTSTLGVLMNAGTLSTPQPVINGNTLTITHTGTLS